jgi:hypothetical protein
MSGRATFLHITDPHVSAAGVPFDRDDQKVQIPEVPKGTREQVLSLLFRRLAERLGREAARSMACSFPATHKTVGKPAGTNSSWTF